VPVRHAGRPDEPRSARLRFPFQVRFFRAFSGNGFRETNFHKAIGHCTRIGVHHGCSQGHCFSHQFCHQTVKDSASAIASGHSDVPKRKCIIFVEKPLKTVRLRKCDTYDDAIGIDSHPRLSAVAAFYDDALHCLLRIRRVERKRDFWRDLL
jgi:hypothetical protein